jgi:hypothetical protein
VCRRVAPLPRRRRQSRDRRHTSPQLTALLGHLATLTRNHLRVAGHDESGFDLLAVPTPSQRRAFDLLGAPIPLTLK